MQGIQKVKRRRRTDGDCDEGGGTASLCVSVSVCVCADQQRERWRERERPSFPAALFPRSLTHIACDGKREGGRERAREVAAFLILNPFREVKREREADVEGEREK